MATGIAVGLIVTAIVGIFGWITGAFQAPRNVRRWGVVIGRASRDYSSWIRRREQQLAAELQAIDEDHAARNVFESGSRLSKRARAEQVVHDENVQRLEAHARTVDDAFHNLRKVDLVYMALFKVKDVGLWTRVRGAWKILWHPPFSMETDVLLPVLKRFEKTEGRS